MASCNASVTIPWFQYFSPITYPTSALKHSTSVPGINPILPTAFPLTSIQNHEYLLFLDEVNKGFCMFQPVRVGEYIAAIVPNLFVIQFLN